MENRSREIKSVPHRQAPEVTKVWPVKEPWYERYALDSFLFMLGMWFLFWIILYPLGYWLFEIAMGVTFWVWLDNIAENIND